MSDIFKKVQRGQRLAIPADAYNAFIDSVRVQRGRQHDLLSGVGEQFRQSTIIKVKNTSGDDLDRFAVLAFDEPIVSPTDNLQQFKNQVSLNGLTVDYLECDSTDEEPGSEDTSTDGARRLRFREPLMVEADPDCPAEVEVKLPSELISGDSLIKVSSSDCHYQLSLDLSSLATTIVKAGTCISVTSGGDGSVTVNNTMTIAAGTGIAVSKSDCEYTISATGLDVGIEAGDCISFEVNEDSGAVTINNDVIVTGGNGIVVSKSDCEYVVSLAGTAGDPKTSIRFVCDIECVQSSGGQYQLQVKYGTLQIPTAILASYSSECDDSGSSGSGGTAITFESIDCNAPTPHFAFTLHSMPSGAAYYKMTVTGDKGSSATVGPSYDHEEVAGQTYWGALVDGWGSPEAGECFVIVVQFYDSSDNALGDPIVWEPCCE